MVCVILCLNMFGKYFMYRFGNGCSDFCWLGIGIFRVRFRDNLENEDNCC